MDARKYIIVPEYKPLYAMAECWGPTHGPLMEPCIVPIDIIGKLLLQSGKEAVNIYEVKKGTSLPPVKLTLDNYRKPYEEIAGITESAPNVVMITPEPEEAVHPVEIKSEPKEEKEVELLTSVTPENPDVAETAISADMLGEGIDETNIPAELAESVVTEDTTAEIAMTEETVSGDATVDLVVEEATTEADTTDPYAGMTKAERKRARREARAKFGEDNI